MTFSDITVREEFDIVDVFDRAIQDHPVRMKAHICPSNWEGNLSSYTTSFMVPSFYSS